MATDPKALAPMIGQPAARNARLQAELKLNKGGFLPALLITALAVAEAGCAGRPSAGARHHFPYSLSASSWACYGISRELFGMAIALDYSPEIRAGETVFCKQQTGSDSSKERCIDAITLSSEALRQQ